jgi:hypothetical protein
MPLAYRWRRPGCRPMVALFSGPTLHHRLSIINITIAYRGYGLLLQSGVVFSSSSCSSKLTDVVLIDPLGGEEAVADAIFALLFELVDTAQNALLLLYPHVIPFYEALGLTTQQLTRDRQE